MDESYYEHGRSTGSSMSINISLFSREITMKKVVFLFMLMLNISFITATSELDDAPAGEYTPKLPLFSATGDSEPDIVNIQ